MSNPVLTRATDNPIFFIGEIVDHSEVKYLPKVDHTPAELDATSRLILKAADVIDKHGHVQKNLGDPRYGFCMNGALNFAEHGDAIGAPSGNHSNANLDARHRLYAALNQEVIDWNNAPGRTKDEVVAKLRAVALGL